MFIQLSVIALLLALGIIMRQKSWVTQSFANTLLRFVVIIVLPLLIIGSISRLSLTFQWLYLPLSACLIVLICGIIAWPLAKQLCLTRQSAGVFISGAMIMNLSVLYPLLSIFMDASAVAALAIFDFGHALMVFTVVYAVACYHGAEKPNALVIGKKILVFPPNIALLAAMLINLLNIPIANWLIDSAYQLGQITIFIVFLALGIYFDFSVWLSKRLIINAAIRIFGGLLAAIIAIMLWRLETSFVSVVLLAAIAPAGFNTLVFATREKLDTAYAANLVSFSLVLSLIYFPLILYFLSE